jgi:Abnormal spindle-like microcephaly-assoc'd, ASPM-SPD-2-Hydin
MRTLHCCISWSRIFRLGCSLAVLGLPLLAAAQFTVTPSSIPYPTTYVGMQSNCQPITVRNTGSASITINSFSLAPFLSFQLQYGYAPRTLVPTQSEIYCVKFVPSAAQAYSGSFTVTVQGSNPVVVGLTGRGAVTKAAASVTPNVLTFAPQALGTTTSQTVTVSNTGTNSFHLKSLALEPPFSTTGFTNSVAINPGKSFSFQVTFTPTETTSYTNTLALTYDSIPGQSASLSGAGTSPASFVVTSFPVLPTATRSSPYLADLVAAGGAAPLTWSLASGNTLPAGVSLSAAGIISGTLSSSVGVGTYQFTAQVQDSSLPPNTATAALQLTVGAPPGDNCNSIESYVPHTTNPLIPLTDLGTGTYDGSEGGLYPGGSNAPPANWEASALSLADGIQPLDASGNPDPNGLYAMLSIGVSITRTIWDAFGPMEVSDPVLNPHLVLVNAAIDGTNGPDWTSPSSGAWLTILNNYLPYQNVSPNQVVAVWVMMPHSNPRGTYPTDMAPQESDLISTLQNLHTFFPNLKIAYLTSNHYGAYEPSKSYSEPYSYEFGFAVQTIIEEQINGQANLNWNPANGPVMAPFLFWGPYTWANGMVPRSDGLVWTCQDMASDGLHPSTVGRNKEAALLATFFKTDPTATPWFLAPTH